MEVPLPLLIILEKGVATVPTDIYRFAVTRASVEKFEALRRMVVTIASMHDYWRAYGQPLHTRDDVDTLIWSYLEHRLNGPRPVAYETARADFGRIRLFAQFCAKNTNLDTPFSKAFAEAGRKFDLAVPRRPTAGFLQHLQIHRDRWLEMQEPEAMFPKDFRKVASPVVLTKKGVVKFPTEAQMDDAIDLERNPVFRAALCILAGQGPRMSELLHMWRCDVLPASYATKFGAQSDGNPFAVYAHPEASTWTGDSFSVSGRNRAGFIAQEYATSTSRRWALSKKERLGWKSMLLTDPRGLSYGLWVVQRYADEFKAQLPRILFAHEECRTDDLHPYFWINLGKSPYRGAFMRLRNLRAAIGRACARVGLDPFFDDGGHGHGLRHFCKWFASSKIGLSSEEVQLVLRQKDVRSQTNYGRRMHELQAKLSARER